MSATDGFEPDDSIEGEVMLRATVVITYPAPFAAYGTTDPKVVAAIDAANFEADPAIINFLMEAGDTHFFVEPIDTDITITGEEASDV